MHLCFRMPKNHSVLIIGMTINYVQYLTFIKNNQETTAVSMKKDHLIADLP